MIDAARLCVVLLCGSLSVAAVAELPQLDRVRVIEAPRLIADAELIDEEGQVMRLHGLRGKVAFVFFGFTNCPDICPLAMERLAQLRDSGTLDSARVAYVMISVDGERDTPAVMKAFLTRYADEFVGLTAAPNRVAPIAEQFSAAFFKGSHRHDGGYDVAHSPQIFVLDARGRLRAELFGASLEAMTVVGRALVEEE